MSTQDEEKKRRIAERRAAAAKAQQKLDEYGISATKLTNTGDASSVAASTGSKAATSKQEYAKQANAAAASIKGTGRVADSNDYREWLAQPKASTGYVKRNAGDNDMLQVQNMRRQESVDLNTLTYDQAMGFATRIVDDKERDSFLKDYRKQAGNQRNANYVENLPTLKEMREKLNSQKPGGIYKDAGEAYSKAIKEQFTLDYKNRQNMKALNTLYDANGKEININTADFAAVVQGIRSIADSGKRKEAIKHLEDLTKTEGSRFYGQTLDKDLLGTYLGSPDFTQEDYNEYVKSFADQFYPQDGYAEQNAETYKLHYDGIEESVYSDSVKRQLHAALDTAWRNSTGKAVPDMTAAQTASEEAPEQSDTGKEGEKGKGWLGEAAEAVGDFVEGVVEDIKRPYAEKPEEDEPQGERTLPAFMNKPEENEPPAPPMGWLKNDGLPDMSSATRLASAGRSDSAPPIPKVEKEVHGPVQRFASTPYIKDDSDVVRAIRKGYYSNLDKADTMRVDEMMQYGTVRQIMGTVTDANAVADVLGNNRGAENVVRESYGMLGKTAAMVIEAILGDEFPAELENDALLVLMEQAERAERMVENPEKYGVLGGDESLPLLERLLTTDKTAQDAIAGIYAARDELEAQQAQIREEEELETQKLLAEAREAVRRGEYSDEQLALVQKYAPEVNLSDMAMDYRRMELGGLIDDWDYGFFAEFTLDEEGENILFADGTAMPADKYIRFKDTAVYKNLEANGVIDTVDYRTALNTQMHRVIDDDTRYAMSLGLTLQEYYDRIGGMTEADICQRAATRIAQQGATMTEEDMQNIAEFGDGVNALEFGSAVGGKATVGLFADFADTLYIGMNEADTVRTAGRMQVEYQNEFGSILGREFYRRDLERLIDSGTLPESMAKSLRMAMSAAGDIYQVGIDPEALGGLRTAGSKARAVVKQLDRFMQENATEGQYEWYNLTAGALRNLEQAAIAIGVGAIAGAAGATASAANSIGFIAGYSIPTWKGYYDDAVLNKNLSGKSAAYIASAKTGVDYYFNIGTYGKIAGQISRKTGLDSLTTKWAAKLVSNAPVAVAKAYAAVKDYVNSHALAKGAATFAGNILSEFGDEFGEGVGENYVDNALVPIFEKAESGAKVTASDVIRVVSVIPSLDIVGAAGDVLASKKEIAITSSLLALGGAFGEGMNTYKSTKAANDVLTGKSSDIGAVVEAIAEDVQDPAFCEQIDAIAEQVREDEAVAIELMTDDGADGLMEREAAATEQAEAHAEKKEAAAAGMEQAAQTMEAAQAKIDSGTADAADEQMLTDAQEALPKDKTSYEEAEREELAKREEAKRLRTEKYRSAKAAAKTRLAQQDADIAAQMAEIAPSIYESGRKSVQDSIQRKKDALLAQIEAEFGKPAEEQDENLLNTLDAQYSALEELEAEGAEDADAIRAKAEERLAELAQARERHVSTEEQELMDTRESLANAQNKQSDLKDVFHALTHDTIYVDETELANIMYETGARNMTEAARALGIKLTRDPKKGVSLTGGYYNDLKDMAPDYFRKEWDLHPEEAIVSMAKERKILKADIDQLKQDEKAEADAYNKKSATARHAAVAELAQEVPEGHALSQFENETAQESDVVMDEAKDAVKGTTHEVHHDNTLKWEAAKRIAQNGLTNTYNELIRKPIGQQFDDAELAVAYECLKILKQNGSVLKSTMLTARLGMSATKTGQSLRMYSMFRRNAAQNAAADAIQMADAWNKKHGKWKSVNLATGYDDAQQMSIGETNMQPFMENEVSRSTSDPAMQKLASDVKARSGLDMYWANMPDGIRGFFDRLRGVIVLNQKIGAAQGMFVTAIHEFTHFMESDPQYEAYANSILKAAYGKDYENSKNRLEDEGQIRDSYGERGQELTPELLTKEIVAAATERILLGDEAFMRQLFARGDGGIAARMLAGMDSFMRKQKAAQEGGEAVDRYKLIEAAREKMKSAIANVGVWRAEANADAQAKAQFAIVQDESGWPMVKASRDFALSDNPKEWGKQIRQYIRDEIRRHGAIVIRTIDGAEIILDKNSQEKARNWLAGADVKNNRARMNAAAHLDEVVEVSEDSAPNEPNVPDDKGKHEWAKDGWRYREAVFEDYDGKRYLLTISVGQSGDGQTVYNIGDVAQIEKKALAPVNDQQGRVPSDRAEISENPALRRDKPSSDTSVAQTAPNVNTQSTQNGPQYFIQTERNVQGAKVQKGAQQTITAPDTYDTITAPEADGEVAMQPQPEGVQQVIEDPEERDANVVSARVMANIDAMNANEEVSYDNPWGLPLNPFQMEQIARFKLEKVKLPGLAYNRATIEQRQLCAILATRQDYRGEGVMSLMQQLEALEQNKKLFGKKVAVVTDADLYYITSQGAIVEASEVDEADIPVDREADQAYARMLDAQANIVPVSMQEKLNAWRYMSMLSSPVTTVKNVGANEIMKRADRVSTMGAAFFDRMAAKRTGSRQVGMTTKSERKAGKEAARKRGRNAFDDTFVAKADTSRSRRYDMGQGRVFQTEWLELGRNLIGFMMDAPDQMAMEAAIVEEMAVMERIGAKIRDEDTGEIREMTEGERYEEAYRRASERFFHADNRMSKLLNELYKTPFFGTVARINIPFNKTTTNVALRLFDYSPLGLAKSIFYDGLYAINHDKGEDGVGANFDQYRFAMGMGRGMTGTMATIAGLLLAQAGYLVAGREDEENDKRREVKGNLGEPYSLYIQIGDTKHEIAFTMPSLAGFAIGAGIWQRLQDDASVQEIVGGFLADSGNALFDNSYVSTLNDLLSGYGSTWDKVMNIIPKTGEAMMQQTFSPAVLRAIAKAFDPYARDTSSKSAIMQSINENVLQGWPVFRTMLPKKYDLTGDEMTQHKAYAPGSEWENAALNFIDSMLSPTATYTAKDDAALCELLDLSYRLEMEGDTEPMSVLPTYLINKKSYSLDINKQTAKKLKIGDAAVSFELTEEEKREINREYSDLLFNGSGTTMYQSAGAGLERVDGLRKMMASQKYERMSDKEKKEAVKDEMSKVKLLIQNKWAKRLMEEDEL